MKKNEAIESHWSVLIDDFNTSGLEFLAAVEAHVRQREVPGVTFERMFFAESGVLSHRREYLRMRRDNLVFDVGAAPYGTGFFFTWWLVRSRARFAWLYLVGYLLVVLGLTWFLGASVNFILAFFGALVVATVLLGFLAREGTFGPPEHVADAPLIGGLFVRLFNPTTYHALDLVAMFQESIRRAVNEAVDGALKQQGRQALSPAQKAFQADGTATGAATGPATGPVTGTDGALGLALAGA